MREPPVIRRLGLALLALQDENIRWVGYPVARRWVPWYRCQRALKSKSRLVSGVFVVGRHTSNFIWPVWSTVLEGEGVWVKRILDGPSHSYRWNPADDAPNCRVIVGKCHFDEEQLVITQFSLISQSTLALIGCIQPHFTQTLSPPCS